MAGKSPNIIFIMTDDQGPWAYGAAGDPNAHTPNLDRLAREGVRMTNYFTMSPVCSPARGCLMTGRYSTEFGIPDYIPGEASGIGLSPQFPTWPKHLRNVGYDTALVGKWHLGSEDEYHPTRHGYNEFTGFRVGAGISKDPVVEVAGDLRQISGYTPDILTDFAVEFVRRKRDVPFLLSLHYWAPHANTGVTTADGDRTWHPLSDDDWSLFRDKELVLPNPDYPDLDIPRLTRMNREYLAAVASVDRNVGRLLGVLESEHLVEDTLVVFTADNGYNLGHNGIWHKGNGRWILYNNRGDRPNMYDNSLRLPLIVRWPGVTRSGEVIEETCSHLDWYPTFLDILGDSAPEAASLRGTSILPLLNGESAKWDNDLFAQYSMWEWNQNGAQLRAYRTPEWKYIRDFKHEGKDELYYLVDDPEEHNNLIAVQDPRARRARADLDARLTKCMERINDPETR